MKNNTLVRIIVSIFFIPGIVSLAYFGNFYFLLFGLVVGLFSFYEFAMMARKKSINPLLKTGLFSVALILLNSYFHYLEYFELILGIVIINIVVELFRGKGSAINNLGATLLGIFYIGLFTSSILEIREFFNPYENGGYVIISIFATIWICDSAAFFGGISLGKHKLFVRVSPNKSWEGAVFGLVFSIISMMSAKLIILDFLSWIDVILIGIVIGTIGQIGDLAESLLKRDAGVKDSSNLIPGHGGIFDRFDSLIVAAPVIYIYLRSIN